MRRLTVQQAEILANKFRAENGLGQAEPIDLKTLLRRLRIIVMFRPLSKDSYGISCRAKSGKKFMLINSNSTLGRQHFTIAHELYHLYFDEDPTPHMCCNGSSSDERNADMFASALLLPRGEVYAMLGNDEIMQRKVRIASVLRIEQMFQVSRAMLLIRLRDLGVISDHERRKLSAVPVKESALEYGYDRSLYESGNEGVTLGDFGEKARILYEAGKISEGHYIELLNMISNGR